MNKLLTCSVMTAFLVTGAATAQAQEQETQPSPSATKEGKAAERVIPGKTPTQEMSREATTDPTPSTSPTEGTAADRTPPGKTATMSEDATRSAASSKIVGRDVVSTADAKIGKVTEVVFDAKGQPDFVVIASEGTSAAVPYAAANSMMRGDKIVMDQSRLARAPKVKPGELRSTTGSSSWKSDSQRYWSKG